MKRATFRWTLPSILALALGGNAPGALAATDGAPFALTLDEALARALAHNYAIAIEREAQAGAGQDVRRQDAAYDLQLTGAGSFVNRTDPANSLLSGAPTGAVAPQQRSLDFDGALSRLLPTGGSLSFLANGSRLRTDGLFSLLSPSYATSFALEVRQPLLRDRAIDGARLRIKVARTEQDRSRAGLKRTVSETLAAVETAYWDLVAAQGETDVRAAAVDLAQQQLKETRARIGAGMLPSTEDSQPRAELERRKGELLAARERVVRSENALKALILDDGGDPLWSLRVTASDSAETAGPPVDLAPALAAAVDQRAEVEEARARLAARRVEVRAARDERLPRLDAYASYARRGLAGRLNPNASPILDRPPSVPGDLDGGLGRALGTIADGLYPDVRVGFSLTVPVGNRAAHAHAAMAQADERRAELEVARVRQAVRVEVLNAAAAVDAARERITAAHAAREAAETQFRSEQERFAVGMSTNFLVLTRQNELSQARLAEIQALSDHRQALAELHRATGDLLPQRHVVLEQDAPSAGASGGSQ